MKKLESDYYYHLVNKNANLDIGLLSPEYMYTHRMFDLFDKSVDKYRERLVNGWRIYPHINEQDLSREEIYNGINKFRNSKDGNSAIYFFRYPPYKDLGANMSKILDNKKIIRIDINNEITKSYIKYIDWGHEGSFTGNKKLTREYYTNVTPKEYFSKYDDNANILFAALNHIAIYTKYGYIPRKCLDIIM